ncbi:MAG: hypothetical protein CL908_18280 [Deltaproteobacteria bacterium]|nr:hypothetical protein [Deltaproteobacteria bacterium]
MKTVHFVSHTLDFAAGGAERVLLDVLMRIDRSRFDVRLVVGRDACGVPPEFEALGLPIELLPHLHMTSSRNPSSFLRIGCALIGSALSLFRILHRERPDVVHVNSPFALHFALAPCLLTQTPLVYHEHGLPRSRQDSIWSIAYPWLIHRVSHTIAITDAVRAEVIGHGVSRDRITTVHNGIEAGSPPAVPTGPSRSAKQGFTIVQIANFLEWKGQDVVLEALSPLREKVQDARVIFYGQSKDLEYESRLRDRIAELSLCDCVEFGGYRTDLAELLPTYDCLIVASRAEPFGLVLLEGMRAGLPVVGSNAGGVPEIVTDGENGLLFEPGDAAGLVDALQRIANDPDLATRLVVNGRHVLETRFSLARQVEAVEAILENHGRQGASDR